MRDHAVRVDAAARPAAIAFAPLFNVAVPFIDRHVREGRREKAAIRTVDGDVSYGELAERVNRCGNVLREMGLSAGDRLLMVVKDCPEFFYLFWGSIKAGVLPVPVNTLLRAPDLQYMIDDSACAAVRRNTRLRLPLPPLLRVTSRRSSRRVEKRTRSARAWRELPWSLMPSPRLKRTTASGSIPPAPPDVRKQPCTGTGTSW